ncbi:MAG: GNAT family N-acetyltransferase [Pseudomonadota bacterium]
MQDPITIHVPGPEDTDLFNNVADGVFDGPVRADQLQAFLNSESHVIVLARAGGVVVGFASAVIYLHPDKPPQLWINEVGTAPTWHRQGIASKVVQTMIELARARGWQEPFVLTDDDNAAARALYAKLGGTESTRIVMFSWDPRTGLRN